MFSASRLAFLSPSRYLMLCILPAMGLLIAGLIVLLTAVQWQHVRVGQQIRHQSGLNQLLRQELQQTALARLNELPVLQSVIAIAGAGHAESTQGVLLTGLRDLAVASGLELQVIVEDESSAAGSVLRMDLMGQATQLATFLRSLSVSLKSLWGFGLSVSRSHQQDDYLQITVQLPPEVVHLTETGVASSTEDDSRLGYLAVGGEHWQVLRSLSGELRLHKKGQL